jgi:signal peptide peptidase SppA
MNFRAIVQHQCGRAWAMEAVQLDHFMRQLDSLTVLAKSGVRPRDDLDAAISGERKLKASIGRDGTATVPIQGVILDNAPWFLSLYGIDYTDPREVIGLLAELAANPDVTQVIFDMDSPGGSHSGTPEMAAAIAAFPKPTATHVRGCMASAALWAGASADTVLAAPSALIGSIGSYIVLVDTTQADQAAGLALTLVASGGVKGHGADGRVTDALKQQAQQIVDHATTAFIAELAEARGLSVDQVKALATGDVWFAAEAQARGLIDGLLNAPAPTPNPDDTPSSETTPPADTSASTTGTSMKITADVLATLIAAFVTEAAFIAERAKAGDDEITIRTAIGARQLKAKDDQVAAANTALATEKAEHAKTAEKLASVQAAYDKLRGFTKGGPKDPGGDQSNPAKPVATYAEYNAMSMSQRSDFFAAGGEMPTAPTA